MTKYGERRENHPGRGVSASDFFKRGRIQDPTSLNGDSVNAVGVTPMVDAWHEEAGGGSSFYRRRAAQGPSVEGPPLETATAFSGTTTPKRTWSKPNPGGYSPDEISNIMRNSGP